MGIQDREYYKDEMKKRAGRPVTFDQKMAASAARHRPSNPLLRDAPKSSGFPIVSAVVTIIILAAITVWFATR